jgi:hypothetical protein
MRAALAYFGFTAVNAFNVGNPLITRPVAEMVLSRSELWNSIAAADEFEPLPCGTYRASSLTAGSRCPG